MHGPKVDKIHLHTTACPTQFHIHPAKAWQLYIANAASSKHENLTNHHHTKTQNNKSRSAVQQAIERKRPNNQARQGANEMKANTAKFGTHLFIPLSIGCHWLSMHVFFIGKYVCVIDWSMPKAFWPKISWREQNRTKTYSLSSMVSTAPTQN